MPDLRFEFDSPSKDTEIRIEITRSRVLSRPPTITYIDPADNRAWNAESLTPEDMGKVIEWVFSPALRRVLVHLPYRIVCPEVVPALRGLKSYQTEGRSVVPVKTAAMRGHPRTALQDFSLSSEDFTTFRARLFETFGWLFTENEDDFIQFIVELKDFYLEVSHTFQHACELRLRIKETGVELNQNELEEVLQYLKTNITDLTEFQRRFGQKLPFLSHTQGETGRLVMEKVQELVTSIQEFRFEAVRLELIQSMGAVGNTPQQHLFSSLEKELASLTRAYPCLRHIEVKDGELVLALDGVKITLSEQEVSFTGRVEALNKYRITPETQEKHRGSSAKGRLTSVRRKKDPE